jgi:hypothetical protein
LIRVLPDPLREEFVNVGLAITDEKAQYARLRFTPRLEGRLRGLGAAHLASGLTDYLGAIQSSYDVAGSQLIEALRTQPTLDSDVLQAWTGEFASLVRLSLPRVFLAPDPDVAFERLYKKLVSPQPSRETNPKLPEIERGRLRRGFVRSLRKLANFSDERIQVNQPFHGKHAEHWLDVVVVGDGAPAAFAHALPMNAASIRDVFLHRGALVEAAQDADPSAIRLGLYSDAPSSRADLLKETQEVLGGAGVQLFREEDLPAAVEMFSEPLLVGA